MTVSTRTARGGALLVAAVAALASANVLRNGFVWDDAQNILANPWVRDGRVWEAFTHDLAASQPQQTSGYYRPVMHVVFAAVYAVAGLRPWAFHLVNLLAHALVSACVFLLLARGSAAARAGGDAGAPPRDGATPWAPLAAALLFAVHPVHSQAVAWIAGIVDVSFAAFFLLALLAATSEAPRRAVPLVAAPALFLLALLSKEPAVALVPVVAVALALRGALRDPARRREALVRLAALAVAVVVYLPLRWNALGGLLRPPVGHVEVDLGSGVASGLALAGDYLGMLVAPVRLSALREVEVVPGLLEPRALAGLAAVATLGAAVWGLRRHPSALLGAALLVLPLLPALYVPVVGPSAGAERYLYLPSAGAALLLCAALEALLPRLGRRASLALAAGGGAVLVAAVVATVRSDALWRDDVTLWTDTVAKAPRAPAAWDVLGATLLAAGRPEEAVEALRRALALDPSLREPRVNLASALLAAGRVEEGLAVAEESVRLLPGLAEAHGVVAEALAAKGRFAEAAAAYERALALNPRAAAIHNGAALTYVELGRKDLALAHLREAARIQPENPIFTENLAALQSR